MQFPSKLTSVGALSSIEWQELSLSPNDIENEKESLNVV